jgi:hypothetical protein
MNKPNLKAMSQEELLKYLEQDFMPTVLEKLAENARLKAEVERLEARIEYVDNLANRYALDDVRSQAEVERLTKAGDDLADAFYQMSKSRPNFYSNAYAYWFAAKEGKQS